MGILGWIAAIPQILSIVKSIIALIRQLQGKDAQQVAMDGLKQAYQAAVNTGDLGQLNQIHKNLVGEPEDLK